MSNEHEALKPCPFCGAPAQRFTIGDDEPNNTGGDVIVCTKCQASSHVEFGRKENLVSRWNTRATPSPSTDTRRAALTRMVELDEEIDAANPGWMTGEPQPTFAGMVAVTGRLVECCEIAEASGASRTEVEVRDIRAILKALGGSHD